MNKKIKSKFECLFLLLFVILFISCSKSSKEKIVGKWYSKKIDEVDKIPVNVFGLTQINKDNTFSTIDTVEVLEEGKSINIRTMNSLKTNNVILNLKGTWEIKDAYLTLTVKETNMPIDMKNELTTLKIIELSNNILITEDDEHKMDTYKRIE